MDTKGFPPLGFWAIRDFPSGGTRMDSFQKNFHRNKDVSPVIQSEEEKGEELGFFSCLII